MPGASSDSYCLDIDNIQVQMNANKAAQNNSEYEGSTDSIHQYKLNHNQSIQSEDEGNSVVNDQDIDLDLKDSIKRIARR